MVFMAGGDNTGIVHCLAHDHMGFACPVVSTVSRRFDPPRTRARDTRWGADGHDGRIYQGWRSVVPARWSCCWGDDRCRFDEEVLPRSCVSASHRRNRGRRVVWNTLYRALFWATLDESRAGSSARSTLVLGDGNTLVA